ncbi:peroxiredoxin [Ahrensia sp. R2A130]|uniref:peroxiredoxin n=1 Tax=Ahrensia sp. R2A130 TaxID=744979 RepID=UPI0001E0AC59|nr:peroxiredoxin [Ahrensia sp. R2A130]EFL90117.1 putative peroxiredoxin bcp [Ahrensia sp. R2A130]
MLNVGDTAPAFDLEAQSGGRAKFPSGKPAVVYFYPKDDTPGCTTEAKEFTGTKGDFEALGVDIIGMSPDTAAKHDKFTAKHDLGITLAADPDTETLAAWGVWQEKSMYGKTYMGVVRCTFLVDADGKVLEAWHKVRVKGHVDAVLEAARSHFG